MRDWEFKEWLIVAGFVLAAAFLFFLVMKSAAAAPAVDVPGCRKTNHPTVCAASYHKCDNIGLNDACLAVAQMDGYYGYDVMRNPNKVTSQNVPDTELPQFSGDKPVERVHK